MERMTVQEMDKGMTVDALMAARERAIEKRDSLRREMDHIFYAVSPYAVSNDRPLLSRADELRLRASQIDVARNFDLAVAEIDDLDRVIADAKRQAKIDRLAEIDKRRRSLVEQLDRALSPAEAINAQLAALDDDAVACGGGLASFAPILPVTSSRDTQIACWRAAMRSQGLLR